MDWYRLEQRELVDSLRAAGPDRPTLCQGWRTRHLAAHLYLRLHRPGQMLLGPVPRLPDADARTVALGEANADEAAYHRLLDAFLAAPSPWTPMGIAGDSVHLLEYAMHHEDVRGANGAGRARRLPAAMSAALWTHVRRMGRLTSARSTRGVVLVVPGGPRAVVKPGRRSIAVTGEVIELALYLTGRTA